MKFDQTKLVSESNMQLLKYMLDARVSYSTMSYSLIFSIRKGPSHNYLIDYAIGFIINYIIIT